MESLRATMRCVELALHAARRAASEAAGENAGRVDGHRTRAVQKPVILAFEIASFEYWMNAVRR